MVGFKLVVTLGTGLGAVRRDMGTKVCSSRYSGSGRGIASGARAKGTWHDEGMEQHWRKMKGDSMADGAIRSDYFAEVWGPREGAVEIKC